ncbi:hypothetical protein BH23ACT12_BH23ACT12_16540 [soil metagenome]
MVPMDAMRSSARLGELAELARPVCLATEQALPLLPALESILPSASLQRGFTLSVQGGPGANSLALALAAGASRAGSWVAAVGIPSLGIASAAELGMVLERLILITPPPETLWPTVAAALIDAFDLVLVGWPGVSGAMARRLGMRNRDRKSVLIPVVSGIRSSWNASADIRLTVTGARWEGLGAGYGRLTARRLEVETGGRRSPMPYRTTLWLPDGEGRVQVEQPDNVRPMGPAATEQPGAPGAVLAAERALAATAGAVPRLPPAAAEERAFVPGAERIGPFPVPTLKSG